jgi:hypothetical protein
MKVESSNSQVQVQTHQPNPALKRLDILVGEWDMEISEVSFLPDPTTRVHGRASFEWIEAGSFLLGHSSTDIGMPPSAVEVIGCDETAETYTMLYSDSRGVSRVCEMMLKDGLWKVWRNSPGFSQRFTGTFSSDGTIIAASWEKLVDGVNWEHDFDIRYMKTK